MGKNRFVGSRNLHIDMLRGMAIVLVMLLHFQLAYGLIGSPLGQVFSVDFLRALFYNGNYGVSIFFVISGFLITGNVLRRYGSLSGINVKHFYLLRLFRLAPSVWLALAIITALGLFGVSHFMNAHRGAAFSNWFFVAADLSVITFWHNVLMQIHGYFNYAMNIYWSLSVEEVFYLLLPFLLFFVRQRWMLLTIALVFIVAAPIWRWFHRGDEIVFMYGYLSCFDQIAFGCLAAIVATKFKAGRTLRLIGAVLSAAALAWVYLRGIYGHQTFGFTLIAIASACFLVCVAELSAGRIARFCMTPLAWMGARSYELYLFHIIALGLLASFLAKTEVSFGMKLPLLLGFFVVSAAVAGLVARFYGNPLNYWLRRRYAGETNPGVRDPGGFYELESVRKGG